MIHQTDKSYLTIPHNFYPREYQKGFYNFVASGSRRGVAVWHRRAGKDKVALNLIIKEAFLNPGIYYYFFPTYNQARKILWDGMDASGFKFLNHIPREIIARNDDGRVAVNNTEMKVKVHTQRHGYESLIQLIGTDNYDQVMGTNPIGCVFTEYSLQNPRAWDFIRPILAENKGWATFIYTPRGRNHGWDVYKMATEAPDWFSELLTVDDTLREDGTPVISSDDIEKERRAGMSGDMIQQEFYCSFDIGAHGSYFGRQMMAARQEGRIGRVPLDHHVPVHTAWDLGFTDDTAIWFFQVVGQEIHLLRYIADSNKELPYYMDLLQRIKEQEEAAGRVWRYGRHFAPHDIGVHEYLLGMSRLQFAREAGVGFRAVPTVGVQSGIEYCRWLLPRCWFDAIGCADGIKAMEMFQREFDEDTKMFREKPKRTWAKHGADAFRTMTMAIKMGMVKDISTDDLIADYQRFGPPSRRGILS